MPFELDIDNGPELPTITNLGEVPRFALPKLQVDLNTNFGLTRDRAFFKTEAGETLLKKVSSVNIPCAVHDGDPSQILQDIRQAQAAHCMIGALVGYPDPAHHGEQLMNISQEDLRAWLLVQLGTFQALLKSEGLDLEQVRPDGALYQQMMTDEATAETVFDVVKTMNPWLFVIAPWTPVIQRAQMKSGLRVAPELFLGAHYRADGSMGLPSYSTHPEAVAHQQVLDQARQAFREHAITSQTGEILPIPLKTFHISPALMQQVKQQQSNWLEQLMEVVDEPAPLSVAVLSETGWV